MGGYRLISLKGKDLKNGTPVTVEGVHDAIESTRSVIILTDVVVDSVEKPDTLFDFKVVSGNFVGTIYNGSYKLTVGSNDAITVELVATE